jgi:Leucine-rich repeat (LRR) protein
MLLLEEIKIPMRTLLIIVLLVPIVGIGQDVYIPDANFKNNLVNNTSINTNGDSEIQVIEASAFTGSIHCYDLNITDITGIEAFTFLTQLNCAFNSLTSLDVSNNTALTELSCENNPLNSLDVSNNTALDVLICFDSEQLECLNINNWNNTVMTLYLFDNTNLTFIELDN